MDTTPFAVLMTAAATLIGAITAVFVGKHKNFSEREGLKIERRRVSLDEERTDTAAWQSLLSAQEVFMQAQARDIIALRASFLECEARSDRQQVEINEMRVELRELRSRCAVCPNSRDTKD